ncbi:MAG: hypothetical protein H6621_04795 [Halobacteriovoraceae bacterium]|nr:hypothetical protein [Halobacteriovoraceae bacterium]
MENVKNKIRYSVAVAVLGALIVSCGNEGRNGLRGGSNPSSKGGGVGTPPTVGTGGGCIKGEGAMYYASPEGSGDGKTLKTPFKISKFWNLAKPGDTLCLLDGRYTGSDSMITPPENLSGTQEKAIKISTFNDGKASIDGEGKYAPISLYKNDWWILEGFNAHDAGSLNGDINVSVIFLNYSSNNIIRRVVGWEAGDGNTNVMGVHHGDNNLVEDSAFWGRARKVVSNSQQGNKAIFRRVFARWEGCQSADPKMTFALSYNSYDALCENCIGTWDSLRMEENYELHDYDNNGLGVFMNNYEVQQPNGIFSHDGFDVLPDVANIRLYGSIAYLTKDQRFHNNYKKWAGPFWYELKGVDLKDNLSYIEPGSHDDIWRMYLSKINYQGSNFAKNMTLIGGTEELIEAADWASENIYSSDDANELVARNGNLLVSDTTLKTANIMKRYVNGKLTDEDLWPWPMNQRIFDALIEGGYPPFDLTKTVFEFGGGQVTGTSDIVQTAKSWLAADSSSRNNYEEKLKNWTSYIDQVIKDVVIPQYSETQTGEIFYQGFTTPEFQAKYPDHQFHMYVPTHYKPDKPIGLLFWLHGGGEWSATDIDHLKDYEMDDGSVTNRSYARPETDKSDYILVAPIAPFGSMLPVANHASRWNVPGADQYLMDIATEISKKYNLNYNKIALAGFSMGGIGAYHQAIRLNDRLSAVMPSGGSWELGNWSDLKTPLYIIQGTYDAYFNSTSDCRPHNTAVEFSRLAKQAAGGKKDVVLKEYPAGHGWDDMGQNAWTNFINGFEGWLTDKVRDPYASEVVAINPWRSYIQESNYGASWEENPSPHTKWISINEIGEGTIDYDYAKISGDGTCSSQQNFNNWSLSLTKKAMKGGKVEAKILGPHKIELKTENVKKLSLWLHPQMIDLSQGFEVVINGKSTSHVCHPNLLDALRSYERRGHDKYMIYHCELPLEL